MLSNDCIETLVLELAASHAGMRSNFAVILGDYRQTLDELRREAQNLKDIRERCPEALQAPPTKEQVAEQAFGVDVYNQRNKRDKLEAVQAAASRA